NYRKEEEMKNLKVLLCVIGLTAVAGLVLPYVIPVTFSPIDAIPGVTVTIPLTEHLHYYGIFKWIVAVILMVEMAAVIAVFVFSKRQ
ncbi:MAG: hypothetical protein Q8L57_00965, partial [bacterium]|nr:hypothetical protein [bacterium]